MEGGLGLGPGQPVKIEVRLGGVVAGAQPLEDSRVEPGGGPLEELRPWVDPRSNSRRPRFPPTVTPWMALIQRGGQLAEVHLGLSQMGQRRASDRAILKS